MESQERVQVDLDWLRCRRLISLEKCKIMTVEIIWGT